MISPTVEVARRDGVLVSDERRSDNTLLGRALDLYFPDVGLAIHRTLEARQILWELPASPVLDLGCGDGRFTRLWAARLSRSPRIVGCDMRSAVLEGAAVRGGLVLALAADGRCLPLRDGCMRTVIANSVLAHVPDVDRLIAEAARVLEPGGRFLAAVPGPMFEDQLVSVRFCRRLGLARLGRRIGDRYHLRWQQWHRDGETVWARRLAAHGMSLITARPYPGELTGLVWSLAFGLIRVGRGQLAPLHFLLWLRRRMTPKHVAHMARFPLLSKVLAPLLTEPVTQGGSLFLVACKTESLPRPWVLAQSPPSRLHSGRRRPDVARTLDWLVGSKIRIRKDEAPIMAGGYGNLVDGRNGQASLLYSEITGYAAQFWLRQRGSEALALSTAAGNCLLRVQVPLEGGRLAGSFPYGLSRPEGHVIPAYFSFDAGICAAGLADLATRTGSRRFAEGARLAGAFLCLMQEADGSFVAMQPPRAGQLGLPNLEDWFGDRCALHGKNAIAFLKLWRLTSEPHWREAARRTLDWVCALQGARGEFPQRAGSPTSMTHTHCYATEGLLYAGLVLCEEQFLTAGIRGAEWLRIAQRGDGALHRDYRTEGTGLPRSAPRSPLHVGPVAQAARIWWLAAQVAPGRPWDEAAARALGFLARIQVPDADPWGGGTFPQSVQYIGPWLRSNAAFSPWEAMFACEAVRLWTAAATGADDLAWSVF